jgi:ABC-type multidrug transport system ATPase subunit
VDAEAEYLIQQALDEVLKGRTALVIAHRLSTIRNADKIIALEGGRIIEIGDHCELLSRGGLYSQLYRRQLELAAVGQSETAEACPSPARSKACPEFRRRVEEAVEGNEGVSNDKSHLWHNGVALLSQDY